MEAILVALIAAIGGILVALIQRGRKDNREDHNVVAGMIQSLHSDVQSVDKKIDSHISWHLDKISE